MKLITALYLLFAFICTGAEFSPVHGQNAVNQDDSATYGPEGDVSMSYSPDSSGSEENNDWDDVETFEDLKREDDLDF
jgi:hypothetical protein